VNIGGLPRGYSSEGSRFRHPPVSGGTTHKEDQMLLNITAILLIALAICGLIKLACLIHS
jgi:hypothetical protein